MRITIVKKEQKNLFVSFLTSPTRKVPRDDMKTKVVTPLRLDGTIIHLRRRIYFSLSYDSLKISFRRK